MSSLDNAKTTTISASAFDRINIDQQSSKLAEAVSSGRALALVCDQAASPQERAMMSLAMLTMGGSKVPAQIAAVAGRGASPERVARFVTAAAEGIRKVPNIAASKARDYTGNVKKAANKWALEHHKGYQLTSEKGAGKSSYFWKKAEADTDSKTGNVTGPKLTESEKVKSLTGKVKKAEADSKTAEKRGYASGVKKAEAIAAESTAAMAAELESLRADLAEALAGEARALHLARHYAGAAGATGAQKAKLTKACKASAARAKKAMAAIGKLFTMPALPGKVKKAA